MKKYLLIVLLLCLSLLIYATSFRITGYLPSYRLEGSERAIGSEVMDISSYTPTYNSIRQISQLNLANSNQNLPPSYDYQTIDQWYGQNVSHIIYYSLKPAVDGSLDLSGIKTRDLSRLFNMNFTYGTNLVISISGSSELFNAVVDNREIRTTFISNLLSFCKEYNFSGIDFDWEYPGTDEEIENFSLLIEESKAIFSAVNKTVSAAVSRYRPLKQEIYDKLDSINLMAYDFYGRHSTYESAIEAAEFLQIAYNIPPEKINLGIPFYGRIFSGLDPQYWTKSMIYSEIRNTYIITPDQDKAGGYYLNGIDMVKKKTNYAKENNLGGVMIWELGQDTFDEYSLLKAIKEEIK
ncbi:MAG: glycoside hydrolase family 18 protein [Spirochaetaceae bacterium]|nr:glycoside hydrolase family 18 protein [Spirochaetaceae bacterium]